MALSRTTKDILLASWRPSSKTQYATYIRKWLQFCSQRDADPYSPVVELILSFLTDLFDSGAGYSTINTARSALSTFLSKDNTPVGQLPIICRFVKGVFNLRPAIPKTKRIWDVSIVLNHLRKLAPVHSLSLKTLTLKTIMLIALLSGQRRQTLGLISLRNITVTNDLITISFGDLLKQSRPGFQLKDISVKAYPVDRRLCPCRYLQEYIKRTKSLRKDQILFISSSASGN